MINMTAFDKAWGVVKEWECPFDGVCATCGDCPHCDYEWATTPDGKPDYYGHRERCDGTEIMSFLTEVDEKTGLHGVIAQSSRPEPRWNE
jgi:hypothetical protein